MMKHSLTVDDLRGIVIVFEFNDAFYFTIEGGGIRCKIKYPPKLLCLQKYTSSRSHF